LGYLDEQEVYLEGQVRAAEPYPWYHPLPLRMSQVQLKVCRARSKRRARHKHPKRA
jgi:hypothetical protein